MDREKVIKGFECCFTDMNLSNSMPCRSCPYGSLPKKENCQKQMFADVLDLLKEQDNCENCSIAIEDRQPIVRCKDCKDACICSDDWVICTHIDSNGNDKHPVDWFCADGKERK